jgi:uncharacterized protein YndB with AHSA1/START domain
MQNMDRGITQRTVESCVTIAAQPAVCWRFLTEPTLLREWFADSIPAPAGGDATADLNFGDGDFFRVRSTAAEEPNRLFWVWQFMGVGPRGVVQFHLMGEDNGTRIEVRDRGQYSERGVHELEEGWADFLSRLRRRIETGENTRYQWSETIGASIVVRANPETALRILRAPVLWRKFFPEAEIGIEGTDSGIHLEFHRKVWAGVPTEARITLSQGPTGLHLSLSHEGWLQVPENCRIAERRKAAESWAQALSQLELMLAH